MAPSEPRPNTSIRFGPQLTVAGATVNTIPGGGVGDVSRVWLCTTGLTFENGLLWRRGRAKEKNQPTLPSRTMSVNAIKETFITPKDLTVCPIFVTAEWYIGSWFCKYNC